MRKHLLLFLVLFRGRCSSSFHLTDFEENTVKLVAQHGGLMRKFLYLGLLLLLSQPVWAASPAVAARTNSNESTLGTSHTVSLPSGIVSGNLLIVFFANDNGNTTVTFPGDWTQLFSVQFGEAGGVRLSAAYRQADGGEGATITVTTSASERSAHTAYRITGHEDPATQEPEFNTFGATSATPDPPNLTPTGGAKDYLWLAAYGQDGASSTNSGPANYTNLIQDAASGGGDANIASAERQLNAASENPGTFDSAGDNQYVAATIAIHPAAAVGGIGITGPIVISGPVKVTE